MATGTVSNKLTIKVQDPATLAWGFACIGDQIDWTISKEFEESLLNDCDDPLNVAAVKERSVTGIDGSLSLSGKLRKESSEFWREWSTDTATRRVRVGLIEDENTLGGYWELDMHLQSTQWGKQSSANVNVQASLNSAGSITWTPAP